MTPSPRIERLRWGSVETAAGTFRDAKLWPGGGRDWDWNETGTAHSPGIQPADVEELLNSGARSIVLGCGQQLRLQVMDETLSLIAERGATAEMLRSQEAIARYNRLAERGEPVAALIHSTC